MPAHEQRLWLVAYDIADPRRLARIARYMETIGVRLQYSLFAVLANETEIRERREALEQRIKPSQDDVRIYPVHPGSRALLLGVDLTSPDLLPQHPAMRPLTQADTHVHSNAD